MDRKKGVFLILLSTLMFASYGTFSRLMGEFFPNFYQAWTRGLFIAVILLPILLWKKQIIIIERKDWGWIAVYIISTCLTQAPIYYAFNHMDIGSATLLFFVSMLLTMYFFGFIFLGEKATKVKLACLLLAGIGMYFIFSFTLAAFTLLAALMAAFNGMASGTEVSSSKKLTGNYSTTYLNWISWICIAITHLAISLYIGETQLVPSLDIAWLYYAGYLVASILGFWLIIEGLKYLEASVGGLIGLLEIVFSITFGFLVFHEGITLRVAIGGVLIMIAASLPHAVELISKKRAV